MADPFRGGIIAELKRDQVHSDDIARTLEYLKMELGRANIPFGLIGGLALRHHGYLRFTEDVDILTTAEGLQWIHDNMVGRGLLPRGPGVRKKLRQTQYKVNIDILTAGEHAGANGSPTCFPSPESDAFVERDGILVLTLEKLIELKLTSGVWGGRAKDLGDVQELIRANALSEDFASKLPPIHRAKFLELLAALGKDDPTIG